MSHETPTYAAALKAARKGANVRQKDLALALGMHRTMLSDVELGKRLAFKTDRTHKIANYLSTDPIGLMALAAAERGIEVDTLKGLDLQDLEIVITLIAALHGDVKKLAALLKQVRAL